VKTWAERFRYLSSFIASLGVHGLLLAFLLLSIDTTFNPKRLPPKQGEIVQAVAIDETRVEEELNRLQEEESQKRTAEVARQNQMVEKMEQAKKVREAEQVKLEKIKQEVAKTQALEEARLAEFKIAKEKERQQLEALKQQQEKEKKKLIALDDERSAEQERVKQMRQEREKEEKKQAEAKKQQLEAKRKKDEAKRIADRKAAEAAERVAAANDERMASEIDRSVGLWKDKIEDNRREAIGMGKDLSCRLALTVLPDGSVQVRLVQSSGNAIYDDLSIKAVYKSQPFPLPEDPVVRDRVKSLELNFLNDQGVDNA